MKTTDVISLVKQLMSIHSELGDWTFRFNNRRSSFGLCSYTNKRIELSSSLLPVMSDEAIKNTIVHEIAHALTKGHKHDWIWRRKCIELGGTGERTGDSRNFKEGKEGMVEYNRNVAKYTLTCPVCGNLSFLNRKPKRSYSCSLHGRGYNPTYKLTITQNY